MLGPGDTCACNPGADHWQCSATAQAMTHGKILFLSRDYYVQMVRSNSTLSYTLNQLFAKRICRLSSLIEEVSLDNPRRRLVKFMLDILKEQRSDGGNDDAGSIPFTHEEISQRLGTARETVARNIGQLKESNLIDISAKKIVVKDIAKLKKLL